MPKSSFTSIFRSTLTNAGYFVACLFMRSGGSWGKVSTVSSSNYKHALLFTSSRLLCISHYRLVLLM